MAKRSVKGFKYKGRNYALFQTELECLPGFKWIPGDRNIEYLTVNSKLSCRQKQLWIHRLITGRGLRDVLYD
jgi:hypothetical protein